MPKKDAKKVPVWDGNTEVLPPEFDLFLYKGKQYLWHKCDCANPRCKRPLAVLAETGLCDPIMTIRIRGKDQGEPEAMLLVKIGATSNEIADAIEKGSPTSVEMFDAYMAMDPVGHRLVSQQDLDALIEVATMPLFLRDMLYALGDEDLI